MNIEIFKNLIQQEESHVLDFKEDNYDLLNDSTEGAISSFIKDIICFSNTMREASGYIITGVKNDISNSPMLLGTTKFIDEATIQEKVKDKIYPRPKFHVHKIIYDNKIFIVYEFPVTKYVKPLSPAIKMRGLQPGYIYFRRGSSNTEASGMESIDINNWLSSLPASSDSDAAEKISAVLGRINQHGVPLSSTISEAFSLSKQLGLKELERFCMMELSGYEGAANLTEEERRLRAVNGVISAHSIELNQYSPFTPEQMLEYISRLEDFHKAPLVVSHTIFELESIVNNYPEKPGIIRFNTSGKFAFPTKTYEGPLNYFIDPSDLKHLIVRIKGQLATLLTQSLNSYSD